MNVPVQISEVLIWQTHASPTSICLYYYESIVCSIDSIFPLETGVSYLRVYNTA